VIYEQEVASPEGKPLGKEQIIEAKLHAGAINQHHARRSASPAPVPGVKTPCFPPFY
jgi:hypothetical protein